MKHIFSLLLFFAALAAQAQELAVKSFTKVPDDLAARVSPRKDANGVECALVKVYVYDDITSVDGGVVGDVITKGLEKWVYLCEGVKKFKLNLKYHYPVEVVLANYGLRSIEPAVVYTLKVTDGRDVDVKETKVAQTPTQQASASTPTTTATQPTSAAPSVTASPSTTVSQEVLFTPAKLPAVPAEYAATIKVVEDATGATYTIDGVSFKMIKVEGGAFMMGANPNDEKAKEDEKPRHQVTLFGYYIGETEVTQALWKAVMGDNPSKHQGDERPVERVSWNDCQKFVEKLRTLTGADFSLPTEAEWEYAARGGQKSQGYLYSGSDNSKEVVAKSKTEWNPLWAALGVCGVVGIRHAHREVKSKQANELGIYDMIGNVSEWCLDGYFNKYIFESITNPLVVPAPEQYRVCRGGSSNDPISKCRVSCRSLKKKANKKSDELGLRLAIHSNTKYPTPSKSKK